jgi:superfamily II DNA or RNA helicase
MEDEAREMKMDSVITAKNEELTRRQWAKLLRALTFTDADSTEIQCFDVRSGAGVVVLPRGVLGMLPRKVEITDMRSKPPMPKIAFAHRLDEKGYGGQAEAVKLMAAKEQGIIVIPPGGGKTEIGLAFACGCKTRTLVIVHTKDLFEQWEQRAASACPTMPLGKIQGKTCQVEHLTIAMAQTLKRYLDKGGKFWRQFGAIIVDESHHSAAETWEWVLNTCPAYYRFGLTATERRADGRHPLAKFLLGPVLKKVKFESQVDLAVQPIRTGFGFKRVVYRGQYDWSKMLRILASDPERNRRIVEPLIAEALAGHTVLVLSRQIKHLEHMAEMMNAMHDGIEYDILTARESSQARHDILSDFRAGLTRVVFATQLADEGLDVPRLDRVFLTFPGKHDGRIIQQVGRAIRQFPDKTDALVYDFVDDLVPPLARQYVNRKHTYKSLGIETRKAVGYGISPKKGKRLVRAALKVARSGRA